MSPKLLKKKFFTASYCIVFSYTIEQLHQMQLNLRILRKKLPFMVAGVVI